jgi:hypothetical protein
MRMFSAGRAGTAAFSASAHWRSSASSEAAEEDTPPVRTHPPHTHSGAHARHRVESRTASGDEVLVVLEGDERDRALAEVMLQGATDIVWRAGLLEVYLFSWVRVGGQKRSVHEDRRQTTDARPRRGEEVPGPRKLLQICFTAVEAPEMRKTPSSSKKSAPNSAILVCRESGGGCWVMGGGWWRK